MTEELKALALKSTFVVINPDKSTTTLNVTPTFFEDLGNHFESFEDRLLISCLSFDKDWPTWEMHPKGDEIVCLLSGQAEMVMEKDGVNKTLYLSEVGSYIVVPKGTWHTAKISVPTAMLFITPGQDTENKPC